MYMFCFENCTSEGRGGKKGGSANFKTKHTEPLTEEITSALCSTLYLMEWRRKDGFLSHVMLFGTGATPKEVSSSECVNHWQSLLLLLTLARVIGNWYCTLPCWTRMGEMMTGSNCLCVTSYTCWCCCVVLVHSENISFVLVLLLPAVR